MGWACLCFTRLLLGVFQTLTQTHTYKLIHSNSHSHNAQTLIHLTHTHMLTQTHMFTHIPLHTQSHTQHICSHTLTNTHIPHTYLHTYIHTYSHKFQPCTQAHTHSHTHKHTCTLSPLQPSATPSPSSSQCLSLLSSLSFLRVS